MEGCELTGDTVLFGKGAWGDAKNASIMFVYVLYHRELKLITNLFSVTTVRLIFCACKGYTQ